MTLDEATQKYGYIIDKVIKQYRRKIKPGVATAQDLRSWGLTGLWRASQKLDLEAFADFDQAERYVWVHVRGEIFDNVRSIVSRVRGVSLVPFDEEKYHPQQDESSTAREELQEYMEYLCPTQANLLSELMEGKTRKKVAREQNRSYRSVNYTFEAAAKKIRIIAADKAMAA